MATSTLINQKQYSVALQTYSALKSRYPKYKSTTEFKFPSEIQSQQQSAEVASLAMYVDEISRELHPSGKNLPYVKGVLYFENVGAHPKPISLEEAMKGKQIIIFFAPWCGHCAELLSTLAKEASPRFWEKTLLVACLLHNSPKEEIENFWNYTKLQQYAPKAMRETLALPPSNEVMKFNDEILLFATPKIVLTSKRGEVLHHNYMIDTDSDKDFERDLELILHRF